MAAARASGLSRPCRRGRGAIASTKAKMSTEQVTGELVEQGAREAPPALDDPRLYANRELSWLDFNDRVLQLTEDEDMPLLERVKFLAIYCSNLDEFFMVRVAGVHDQVDAGIDARGRDGLSPPEVLDGIRERVIELGARHSRQFEDVIRPALAE